MNQSNGYADLFALSRRRDGWASDLDEASAKARGVWGWRIKEGKRLSVVIDELRSKISAADEILETSRDPERAGKAKSNPPGIAVPDKNQRLTVVVWVGDELDPFRVCLASLLRNTPRKVSLIFAGADEAVLGVAKVAAREHERRVCVEEGDWSNLVFEQMLRAPGDLILVHRPTRFAARWSQALKKTVYAQSNIAAAFPVLASSGDSDPGDASYTTRCEQYIEGEVANSSAISVGYFRRDALAALGFSGVAGRDFGSFQERALEAGWKVAFCRRSGALPVASPIISDADLETIGRGTPRNGLLFVFFKGGGGTPRTSWDLARGVSGTVPCFVLETDVDEWRVWKVMGTERVLAWERAFCSIVEWHDQTGSERTAALLEIIAALNIGMVHVRHFLNVGPEIIRTAKKSACRVVVSFHDFHSVCPNVNLIDASGGYCGGDCSRNFDTPCEGKDCRAISTSGFDLPLARLRDTGAEAWRKRVRKALDHADGWVTTSRFAADSVAGHFPMLAGKIEVIEHGRDLDWHPPRRRVNRKESLKVAVIGHINRRKGGVLLQSIGQLAEEYNVAGQFEWHFFGTVANRAFRPPGSIDHGSYDRADLQELVLSVDPDVILIPSVMIETYCHVLTEAWSCGVPVVAMDRGALGERVRYHGAGWLVNSVDAKPWLECLLSVARRDEDYDERVREVSRLVSRSVEDMAADYLGLYQKMGFTAINHS